MPRLTPWPLLAVIALVAAACDPTEPTGPVLSPDQVENRARAESPRAAGPAHGCQLARVGTDGALDIKFKPLDLRRVGIPRGGSGKVVQYRYRSISLDGQSVNSVITCTIPDNPRAIERMNEILGVPAAVNPGACPSSALCGEGTIDVLATEEEECDKYLELDWDCSDNGGECLESAGGAEGATINSCNDNPGGGSGPGGTSYGCNYFHAWAPPMFWGSWTYLTSSFGSVLYDITASPVGETSLWGRVQFYSSSGWVINRFWGFTTFRTGSGASSISASFMGQPYGTAVGGRICWG